MPPDGSRSQGFRAVEPAHTQNPAASTAPPWAVLATFSVLNVFAGIFLWIFLARSSSQVTGFAACLVLLGLSYVAWFAASVRLWKRNLDGLSSLAIASSASAASCIVMLLLMFSRAAAGFSAKAFQVAWDPFELSRLWLSLVQTLTFASFFYVATSVFLFFRFRRVWVRPRPRLLVHVVEVFLPGGQMRRVLLWWLAINSFGVALAVLLTDLGRPSEMHLYDYAAFVVILALLGALQVVATCWVISLLSLLNVRNKIFLMVLGSIVGILTAFGAVILGMTFLWVYAAVGFWPFAITGIVFGALAGHSQWRSLFQPHNSR